jgi:uncharacterized damage-inducible protein DinB
MNMTTPSPDSLVVHLRYHRWASNTLLQAVAALSPPLLTLDRSTSFKTIPQTLLHLYKADQVWFSRLTGYLADATILDRDFELSPFAAQWNDLLDRFVGWAELLTPEDWGRSIQYRNSEGRDFSNPVWQIVLHVVNHGTAHRAQVASMLRQSNVTPPNLDLITYYRAPPARM